ncbi:hypothetical protein JTB14_014516 [Gonioctena quinquepunctata]|nr:hypothetical protein JTB14_014516 [Gonioctena quinquepunctata]
MMTVRNNISAKSSCVIIGVLHLILIACCVYERIWELIKLEEPFLFREHKFIFLSYIIQIAVASLLIYGSVTEKLIFTVPWLVVTTPVLMAGTFYAMANIFKEERTQIFFNLFVVGFVWWTWYIVVKYNSIHRTITAYIMNLPIFIKHRRIN